MSNGISILEVIIGMCLILTIMAVVINTAFESSQRAKNLASNQEILEGIFHTVDTLKSDLTYCGMRLQEVCQHFDLPLIQTTKDQIRLSYGIFNSDLIQEAFKGDKEIMINDIEYFKKKKRVIIYDVDFAGYEINEIKDIKNNQVILVKNLQHNYQKNSLVVQIKEIEYKIFPSQKVLKRKIDYGTFQPLLENVTDFYICYTPSTQSVLYRIEINRKEQIRGYVFLPNMVLP